MTTKLKCPFCGKKLWYDEQDGVYRCMKSACVMDYEGGTEQLWQALIQAKQDLEHSEKCCSAWEIQALDYKAETIALSGKLKIARQALEGIKKVCDNFRWCESNIYMSDYHDGRIIAEITNEALELTEHKE